MHYALCHRHVWGIRSQELQSCDKVPGLGDSGIEENVPGVKVAGEL